MQTTRELASEYRMGQWVEIMRTRKESGLSIRQYCKTAGIHESRYYYWQKKIRQATVAHLPESLPPEAPPALPPAGWTVCESVQDEKQADVGLLIEINGCGVHVEKGADMELLGRVCRMLRSLC